MTIYHFPGISGSLTQKFRCLEKLNESLKELNLVEAYTLARKMEVKNLEGSK